MLFDLHLRLLSYYTYHIYRLIQWQIFACSSQPVDSAFHMVGTRFGLNFERNGTDCMLQIECAWFCFVQHLAHSILFSKVADLYKILTLRQTTYSKKHLKNYYHKILKDELYITNAILTPNQNKKLFFCNFA